MYRIIHQVSATNIILSRFTLSHILTVNMLFLHQTVSSVTILYMATKKSSR